LSCIELDIVLEGPILLNLAIAPNYCFTTVLSGPRGIPGVDSMVEHEENYDHSTLHAPHSDDQDLTGYVKFSLGPKSSTADAGVVGEISITDDYVYVCVLTGSAGNAIWKKTVLFAS
jgi:hypothetical protein